MDEEAARLTEQECFELLDRLFPNGPSGNDVLLELAPEGWERSPLVRLFHPSVEQVHKERVMLHRRIGELGRKDKQEKPEPEPTLAQTKASYQEAPVNADRELREIVALCLWDVFSDGHEVTAADGRIADLGSFRGSAGTIAEWVNRRIGAEEYNYMHFYMGPWFAAQRADIGPVHRLIFKRLKAAGCDWRYHFPQLYLVDLKQAAESGESETNFEEYSPSAAFENEQKEKEDEESAEKLQAEIHEMNEEAKNAALDRPPPEIVLSYSAVFEREPKGWPPEPEPRSSDSEEE